MRSLRPVLLAAAGTVALLIAAATARGEDRTPVTVVDNLGRTVTVPGRVGRLLSLEPEVTRIIVALGAGDRLVGIDHFLRFNDHLFPLVFPAAASLPLVSDPAQDLSIEEAVRLRPDVVFASPSESRQAGSIERKLRVPVVALASMGRFPGLLEEIRILGRLLGREARAGELVSRFEETVRGLALPGTEAAGTSIPTVYLAFWNSLVRTPVAYDPVDAAGGRNVAAGTAADHTGSPGVTVSLERLLLWDPEVILVQGNYPPSDRRVTVEAVLRD
ncbi:MAG: ABC transporter substrate-binding protein, partial [Acidobacteria bacterium]|nr:ABC transporter substrate-binding protein [Acidobacteriota bacterium]